MHLCLLFFTELEGCIITWDFMETIHSRSYTYMIKNLYSDPAEIFDKVIDDDKIMQRADSITKCYDDFINMHKNIKSQVKVLQKN